MTIQLSEYAQKAIEGYIENRNRHAEKVAHIHDLRGKADNLENRAESLATELRTARAEYKAAKEEYQATADMGPVAEALQRVKALEAEVAVVQELEPVARRAADDAARMEHAFVPQLPYQAVADDILDRMPDELCFALWLYQKAYGRPKFQDGSGRWAALIDRLTKDASKYEAQLKAMIAEAAA